MCTRNPRRDQGQPHGPCGRGPKVALETDESVPQNGPASPSEGEVRKGAMQRG